MTIPVCTVCGDTGKVFDEGKQIEKACRHCKKGCPQEGERAEGESQRVVSGDCNKGMVHRHDYQSGQEDW